MLHDVTFRDRWFRNRGGKGMKTFPVSLLSRNSSRISKVETEPFHNRCFPVRRLDSIRVVYTWPRGYDRHQWSRIWCEDFATYPAIVEISTAADRQSGFRLHRVRQRDLKSFGLINRIFGGWRIKVDWNGKWNCLGTDFFCCEDLSDNKQLLFPEN